MAFIASLAEMSLDKSSGSNGHDAGAPTKADFVIAHCADLINARIKRSTIIGNSIMLFKGGFGGFGELGFRV